MKYLLSVVIAVDATLIIAAVFSHRWIPAAIFSLAAVSFAWQFPVLTWFRSGIPAPRHEPERTLPADGAGEAAAMDEEARQP